MVMAERIRDTGDELVLTDDQRTLLRVTSETRLLGAALGGVHVLSGGSLIASGIINQRLVVDSGGACYASGYVRAVPRVAEGALLDVSGQLDPVRWPPAEINGTILIAVGARYGHLVLTADGTFAPYDPATVDRVNDATARFRITRSGSPPTLEGPIELTP